MKQFDNKNLDYGQNVGEPDQDARAAMQPTWDKNAPHKDAANAVIADAETNGEYTAAGQDSSRPDGPLFDGVEGASPETLHGVDGMRFGQDHGFEKDPNGY